jgi:hypothetical protein
VRGPGHTQTPRGRKLGARPRGEGPPHGQDQPTWATPSTPPGHSRQAFVLGAPAPPAPRRPAEGQSSRPRPGPDLGRATFSASQALWEQGCAALAERWPPALGLPWSRSNESGSGAAPAAAGVGRPGAASSPMIAARVAPVSSWSYFLSRPQPSPHPPLPPRPPLRAAPRGAPRRGLPSPPSPRLLPSSRPPPPPPPLRAALRLSSRRSHLLSTLLSPAASPDRRRENPAPLPQPGARALPRPSPDAKGSDPAPNYPARRARAGARGDSWLGARLRRGAED